ncbi:MAG: anti-sigma factor domain-containing protein [Paenibacillaceae bacterium]
MSKGIVMEVDASVIIVMTIEGRFTKIPLEQRTCQIGEEIVFTEVKPSVRKPWIIAGSFVAMAAAILLLLFNMNPGSTVMANKQIVAYVSIDINPSVEMGIDEHDIVLEIRGLNPDGEELIRNINFAGKSIDTLMEDLLQKAEEKYLSKGEGDIIISSTMGENGNADSKVNDVILSTKLKEVALQHIEKSHPEQKDHYQVTAFAADKEVRKTAKSKGLSAGKYTIYLNAKDKGQETTIEDLKKESVHSIAKKVGGIDKLIESGELSKEKTSKLLKEDENGDLDRKLNNSKNAKKNEDKKNEDNKNEDKKVDDKKVEDKKAEDKKKFGKTDDYSEDSNNNSTANVEQSRFNSTEKPSTRENRINHFIKSDKSWLNFSSTLTPTPSISSGDANKKEREKKTSKRGSKATPQPSTEPNSDDKVKEKDNAKEKEKEKEKEKVNEEAAKNRNDKINE